MNQFFVELMGRLVREEEGQDLVEYALLLGLISIVAVAAITATGQSINGIWLAVQAAVGAVPAA